MAKAALQADLSRLSPRQNHIYIFSKYSGPEELLSHQCDWFGAIVCTSINASRLLDRRLIQLEASSRLIGAQLSHVISWCANQDPAAWKKDQSEPRVISNDVGAEVPD